MRQKGVVFTTTLTTRECANIFRSTGESVRGAGSRLLETAARVAGNGEHTGYYTPEFSSPFAAIDGVPDFAIGLNILKFAGGAQANGTHVHMYVDDEEKKRTVQIVSKHGLADGGRAARMVRKFFEEFQAADRQLRVTEGNI